MDDIGEKIIVFQSVINVDFFVVDSQCARFDTAFLKCTMVALKKRKIVLLVYSYHFIVHLTRTLNQSGTVKGIWLMACRRLERSPTILKDSTKWGHVLEVLRV